MKKTSAVTPRRPVDDIEIVEPPVKELSKRNRGWRRSCLTGCGWVVLLVVAAVVAVRLFIGQGPQTIKAVPAEFPADIPLYDRDAILRITFISGRYKDRGVEVAALFPKIILSPLLLYLKQTDLAATPNPQTMLEKEASVVRGFWKLLTTPVGGHRDTVQIEWTKLRAEPNFILSYYRKELTKNGYQILVESEGAGVSQFSFSKPNSAIGALWVEKGEAGQGGTPGAILTVNLPPRSP